MVSKLLLPLALAILIGNSVAFLFGGGGGGGGGCCGGGGGGGGGCCGGGGGGGGCGGGCAAPPACPVQQACAPALAPACIPQSGCYNSGGSYQQQSYGYSGTQQSYASSSYAQPVAQSSYVQPQQSYAQPQQSYAQPQQSYAQPQAAPASNYVSAPARPVAVPQQASYASGPAPAGPSYAQPAVQVPPAYATGQAAAGQTLQEVVDDGEDQQSASNNPNVVDANAQLSSNSTSSELTASGNETSSAEAQTKEPVAISELKLTNDTECNSEELRAIITEHMDEDLNSSKRVIQLAAEAKFGGRFDVICSSNDFSYVTNTELFCQETKQTVSCYAYRQLT